MASYDPITLLSQLSSDIPADTEINSNWPAADRQLRAFIASFLGISFGDTGALNDGVVLTAMIHDLAVTGDKIANGTITANKLAGSIDGSTLVTDNSITSAKLETATASPGTGAVSESKIQADAVTRDKIKNGEVIEAKLASDAVTNAKIKNYEINAVKIAKGSITGTMLEDPVGNKTADGCIGINTIDVACLSDGGNADIRIPVVGGTAKLCTVGGKLTATMVADELVFEIDNTGGNTYSYAKVVRTTSAQNVRGPSFTDGSTTYTDYWNLLTFTSVVIGGTAPGTMIQLAAVTTSDPNVSGNAKMKVKVAGTYLVRAQVAANSTGKTSLNIATEPHNYATSSLPTFVTGGQGVQVYIPLGTTGIVQTEAIVDIKNVDDPVYLYMQVELDKDTNALGPVESGAVYAAVHFIRL